MNIRIFSALFFGLAVIALSCQAQQPNVVLFFIDDLGYKDLGCYGSEFYETPRLDKLAENSVRFTQFYAGHPVCSPTRAALMSGKAPQRLGITQWIPQPSEVHFPHDEISLAEAFEESGYATGYVGKWHLGEAEEQMPTAHGFNWMRGVNRAGAPGSYFHPFTRKKKNGQSYWDVPDMDQSENGDYLTDKLTDHAIDFISTNKEKPFFLCLSHYAVHTPIQTPKDLVAKYEAKKEEQFGGKVPELIKERNNSRTNPRQDSPGYAGMVENLDTNVGRVLDKLDELGLTQNTIVVFTSDNGGLTTLRNRGGPTSLLPLRGGKGWCYEGGVKIPTLISWPGKIEPRVSDAVGITMDLYPTLLELTHQELKPEQHLDGMSLVPQMKGLPTIRNLTRTIGWYYPHDHNSGHTPSSALRSSGWKLIYLSDKDTYELYNLKVDESESNDLASEKPRVVKELAEEMKEWLAETVREKAGRN